MVKRIRQAVILAGGLGTRLLPITLNSPKPMIKFYGKPFLQYIIELLKDNNIEEVVLLVGYLHEQIEAYFGNGEKYGLRIKYSFSPVNADTGTRLRNAYALLEDHFLLLYGDNYWPLKLDQLLEYYNSKKASALVTVYRNTDNYSRNNMLVDEDGTILIYDRKREHKDLNCIDIGYFLLNKEIIRRLPGTNCSFEDYSIQLLIKNKEIVGYKTYQKYYGLSNVNRIPVIRKYFKKKRIIFLDRDGIINKKPKKASYVTKWNEFVFLPKVAEALSMLQEKGFTFFIITNQAGVGRGLMTYHELNNVHSRMLASLKKKGIHIKKTYACLHDWNANCFCRKPKPGLFFQAASEYCIDLYGSYYIGDDVRDIMAGKAAGCKTIYISNTSHAFKRREQPDIIAESLLEAAQEIIKAEHL